MKNKIQPVRTNYSQTYLYLLATVSFILSSCDSQPKTNSETNDFVGELAKYQKYDENANGKFDDNEMEVAARAKTDSIMNSASQNFQLEKSNFSQENSGIEITSVKIVHDEYSPKWDKIQIKFKNNNNKTVKAIQFIWYDVKNVFDEPVSPTYTGGNMEEIIKPGGKTYGEWDTYSDDIVTAKVYVQKIMFTDGTKWVNE